MKKIALGVLLLTIGLTGCGHRYRNAQCVDAFNNIADPAQCQTYQTQYASNMNNAAWLGAVPYRYAYGGTLNGMNYGGATYVPVYQQMPSGYRTVSQKSYTSEYSHANGGRKPTLAKPPSAKALKASTKTQQKAPTPAKTAPKNSTNNKNTSPSKSPTKAPSSTKTKTPTKAKTTTKSK